MKFQLHLMLIILLATAIMAAGATRQLLIGTFTADGALNLATNDPNAQVQLDGTFGAGTVTFTCRVHRDAASLAYSPAKTCTSNCIVSGLGLCQRVTATLAGATSPNIRFYVIQPD